jgi:hypothetical protein
VRSKVTAFNHLISINAHHPSASQIKGSPGLDPGLFL